MLTPDWTFFPQLFIFLATVLVLNLILFRPVRKVLEEREKGTVHTGDEASDLKAEAARLQSDLEGRLKAARDQAAIERAKLRTEGQAEAAKLVAESHRQAEETVKKLTGEISKEYETARAQLGSQAQGLAESMVKTLLGGKA